MEVKCCICGKELENQYSCEYLCKECDEKYGDYEDEQPSVQPMRRKKKYDDKK